MSDVLELAENANAYTPLRQGEDRIATGRYVLWLGRGAGPGSNVAQRFRFDAGDLDAVREEIHRHVRARGRSACSWEVGTHARPADLVERLHSLGVVDDQPDALAVGMVLTEAPPGPSAGVEVRRAETTDEIRLASRIAAVAFGGSPPEDEPPPHSDYAVYLAYVDGEPVARASVAFSGLGGTLFGGATLPDARGRGAYRALVAARWAEAVARGTPLLVTQAGAMSRPILAGLGFRAVCEIRILVDDFGR